MPLSEAAILKRRLKQWQKLFGLDSWKITLEIQPAEKMSDALGQNFFSPEHETSDIYMRVGEGEATLVHELLHLVIDGHKGQEKYSPMHERAINKLAAVLVQLVRRGKKVDAHTAKSVLQCAKKLRQEPNVTNKAPSK